MIAVQLRLADALLHCGKGFFQLWLSPVGD
jgi:hypothetical protein